MIDCTSPGNWISSSHLTDRFLPGTGAIPDRTGCGPKGSVAEETGVLQPLSQACGSQPRLSLHTPVKRHRHRQGVLGSVLASQAQE